MQLDICFCSDKNLVDHIPVVINSVLKKNSQHDITIHLIHNIKEDKALHKLEEFCDNVGISLNLYHKKWGHRYNSPLKHNITEATMLRLYIPELIQVDRLLYLDIDILVNMELSPIYNMDLGSKGIALKDSIHESWKKGKTNKISGNCGVIMMSVDILRKNDFTNKCLKDFNSGKYGYSLHDQDLINIYCDGEHAKLQPQHNIYIGQDEHHVMMNEEHILHFAGSKKPYKASRINKKYKDMWNSNKNSKEFYVDKNLNKPEETKVVESKPQPKMDVNLDSINFGVTCFKNYFYQGASSNVGDYIQTLAQINIYRKFIESKDGVVFDFNVFLDHVIKNDLVGYNFVIVNRDNLSKTDFKGLENVITIMNGWWMHKHNTMGDIDFNIPNNMNPIFTSFHISNKKMFMESNVDKLRGYKVGCRDMKTTNKLKEMGVDCFFSGCLTTTIDFLEHEMKNQDVHVVDTRMTWNKDIKITSQMNPKWKNVDPSVGLHDAFKILKNYSECKEVFTSRLHCYLPCLAMGVPVTFQSPEGDGRRTWGSPDRFEGLFDLKDNKDEFDRIRKNLLDYCLQEIKVRCDQAQGKN